MIASLFKPMPFKGDAITRIQKCRVCQETSAIRIGEVDYWDIKRANLVQCVTCKHIQLDPMLNDQETAKGCYAYYIEETLRTNKKEIYKNCVRNFRRGFLFAYNLKSKNIYPKRILEIGSGSGYFAAGIQFVLPAVEVTVMDVNKEVLNFNRQHHGFNIVQGVPDVFVPECVNKFDLVIARDVIEHVSDISKVLANVNEYLVDGGYFHFITPNGFEDVWKHYVAYKLEHKASELLINHVNYFDGHGLKKMLEKCGFSPIDYYTYKLKYTFRGLGRKLDKKLMAPLSKRTKADYFIDEQVKKMPTIDLDKEQILAKWYISKKFKIITFLYSLYQHASIIKLNPARNVGHEIYGLYKKCK